MKSAHRPYVQLHNAVGNDNLVLLFILFLPGLASIILPHEVAHKPHNVVEHKQGHHNPHQRNRKLPETSPGQSGPRIWQTMINIQPIRVFPDTPELVEIHPLGTS